MSETFTNVLTTIGQQKKAEAEANNSGLNITTFQVGDGNGAYYEPTENQTALKNTKYTGTFTAGTQSQIIINPSAANEVLYKCFIPADVGGFTIRELGLFDNDGDLILICKLPAQDKFSLSSGLYQPLTFTPKIIYTNPTTSAILTPTSQTIPTTGEVTTLVETIISESIEKITYTEPIVNTNGLVSLSYDDTLKVVSGALSVAKTNSLTKFCFNSGNVSSGNADLISYSGLIVSVKTGGNYVNASGTNADGDEITLSQSVTLNMTGYANGSYNLFVTSDKTLEAFVNTIYKQTTAPTTLVTNTIWLDTSVQPFCAKKYNGSSWINYTGIPIGKAVISGGAITSVSTNAYNQNDYDFNLNSSIKSGSTLALSVLGLSVPNYTNPISKSWGVQYTAECNGVLSVDAGSNSSNSYLTINGTSLNVSGGSGAAISSNTMVILAKGDIYQTSGVYGTVIFFPMKGVS